MDPGGTVTLDTRIYVHDAVDARQLFMHIRQLLSAGPEVEIRNERESYPKDGIDNAWCIEHPPGQGLPAWLMVYYRPDRAYRSADEAAAHEDYCDPADESNLWENEDGSLSDPCDGSGHTPACWAEVSLDTAYGYSHPEHGSCGNLHAWLVANSGSWLDSRGVAWSWRNEFTGEVHQRFDGLSQLGGGGAEATDWFRNIVVPALGVEL